MSDTECPKRRFTLGRLVLWGLGGLVVLGVGLYGLDDMRTARRIKTTVADLDDTDPGWRLEEIEAARITIADKDNSAILCVELARALGKWPDHKFDEKMTDILLPERLDDERMKLLDAEMTRLGPIRLAARRLADMPLGRHKIEYAFNPLATLLPDVQETRKAASLFRYEMLYQSNKGNVSEAVRAGRACVCAGRSFYDDPNLISQLVRIAIIAIGLNGVERALSLGESNEAELVALDKLLADEEKHNSLLVALRGERASSYQLFSRLGSGAIPSNNFRAEMGMTEEPLFERMFITPRWQMRRQQPVMMDMMNRLVENARLPSHEQASGESEIDREIKGKRVSAPLIGMLIPATNKVAEACRRKTGTVAAMRGLIAVERFRMKYGKWPAKLSEVVPEFLDSLPTDPFDGTPIKMVRTSDGIIVYTVGNDKVDDGGKLNRKNPNAAGSDLGFQLWDKAKRRQPASSPKPEEGP